MVWDHRKSEIEISKSYIISFTILHTIRAIDIKYRIAALGIN